MEELCTGADVVVHLAFIIVAGSRESEHINLEGSRNVFESAVAAGAQRLVYASSVAAYGFPALDRPIVEDDPAAGNANMPYSHHKAQVEALLSEVLEDADIDAYIFRPCIVAGPQAPILVNQIPYVRWGEQAAGRGPRAVRRRADPQAGAARPGRAVPARPPRRRRDRAARRRPGSRRARGLQLGRRRDDHDVATSRASWGTTRCRCPTWRSTRPPRSSRGCR